MATSQERVQGIIQGLLGAWMPTHTAIKLAKDATEYMDEQGLLMSEEYECLPSWVYDHPDVCTNPHRMGGQPCIRGTRVQVDIIFNLMDGPDGCTDGEITEFYPSVPTDAINRLRTAREEHNNG